MNTAKFSPLRAELTELYKLWERRDTGTGFGVLHATQLIGHAAHLLHFRFKINCCNPKQQNKKATALNYVEIMVFLTSCKS